MHSEKYLREVTVGEIQRHDRTVLLVPHDEGWAAAYETLAGRVRAALGEKVLLLEHVGSTAVPELAAKPVIDIVLAVADCADETAYVPGLSAQGYRLHIREPAWFHHRVLKASDIECNLHVFSTGCDEIERMLVFRNWLRTHEDDRRLYASVKADLAARTWGFVQEYADAKTAIVREILGRALGSAATY